MTSLRLVPVFLGLLVCCALSAAPRAVVVVGLAAGAVAESRLRDTATGLREAFRARGLADGDIVVLGASEPARREAILRAVADSTTGSDEFWLVLLGTSVPGRNGEPAFQVGGQRLTAGDLAGALHPAAGPCRVVVATSRSGGFVPVLSVLPQVEVVAATAADGELNEPRFGEAFAAALREQPAAGIDVLAADAARRIAALYAANGLAQTEHATGWDRAERRAIRIDTGAAAGAPFSATPTGSIQPQPSVAPKPLPVPEDRIARLPATEEARALIAEGGAAANGSEYAAVILSVEDEFTVETTGQGRFLRRSRTYVRTGEALDRVASVTMPVDPPRVLPQLRRARIVQPDGAQVLFEPAFKPVADGTDPDLVRLRRGTVELPEVGVGCVVEIEYQVDIRSGDEAAGFSREWRLGGEYPTLRHILRCSLPARGAWRWFAPNLPPPQEKPGGERRELVWTARDLPALEAEPAGPPSRRWAPWVGISAIGSWEEVAVWYRRIAADAMVGGPKTAELGRALAAQHPGRMALLRAAYERVAALRYVAIELGVGGYRPRLPDQVLGNRFGDCKDKANLLVAVLRAAGVEADFVLVNRRDVTFTDFPSMQFNHALVHVPAAPEKGQAQPLWLDPTDRLAPFGSVPAGDLGRAAFIVGASGKPRFETIANAIEEPVHWGEEWIFSPTRSGAAQVVLEGQGAADESLRRLFAGLSPAERLARVRSLLAGAPPSLAIESVAAPDAYDLATPFRVVAEVRPRAGRPSPCPPGLDSALAAPARRQPLLLWEGRPWTYVQTVRCAPTLPEAETMRTCGGLALSRRASADTVTTEVRWSGGELPADAHAAVRTAWLDFLAQPLPP